MFTFHSLPPHSHSATTSHASHFYRLSWPITGSDKKNKSDHLTISDRCPAAGRNDRRGWASCGCQLSAPALCIPSPYCQPTNPCARYPSHLSLPDGKKLTLISGCCEYPHKSSAQHSLFPTRRISTGPSRVLLVAVHTRASLAANRLMFLASTEVRLLKNTGLFRIPSLSAVAAFLMDEGG